MSVWCEQRLMPVCFKFEKKIVFNKNKNVSFTYVEPHVGEILKLNGNLLTKSSYTCLKTNCYRIFTLF